MKNLSFMLWLDTVKQGLQPFYLYLNKAAVFSYLSCHYLQHFSLVYVYEEKEENNSSVRKK